MPCVYALSVRSNKIVSISKCLGFDPLSDGAEPWRQLYETGKFEKASSTSTDNIYGEIAVGIAAQVKLAPFKKQEIEMSLVWDMPVIHFRNQQKNYNKFYTKFFGSANATLKIVEYIFKEYKRWEDKIYKYQERVLNDQYVLDIT